MLLIPLFYHTNHQLPESDHMATHTKKLFFHLLTVNVKKMTGHVTMTGKACVLLAAPEFQLRSDAFLKALPLHAVSRR